MKNIRLTILRWLTGKFGPIITPVISGVVGTTIGTLYSFLSGFLVKWPDVHNFFMNIWNSLDANTQAALQPMTIGAIIAGAVYMYIQEQLNKLFVGEVKEDQKLLNEVLPKSQQLKVDGLPLEKTQEAKEKVISLAKKA